MRTIAEDLAPLLRDLDPASLSPATPAAEKENL
ncbi:hypothetical protein FRACA_3060001 [Frankia canadensis]|uniref:Uncharacterized protein n=1 Tax=Frankia canadensis TaxID=1836972 RepID=A0A2I2KU55_9ACTN|nr:hypothetical protein FRACA_3060001 [Frankia canadensis]SOU56486.1 hypothetical protein FRACA_3060001 [Frankia canadensis]